MTQGYRKNAGLTKGLHWSARIVGGLATALFTLFIAESEARVLAALS
jgi:hypothetical protein